MQSKYIENKLFTCIHPKYKYNNNTSKQNKQTNTVASTASTTATANLTCPSTILGNDNMLVPQPTHQKQKKEKNWCVGSVVSVRVCALRLGDMARRPPRKISENIVHASLHELVQPPMTDLGIAIHDLKP